MIVGLLGFVLIAGQLDSLNASGGKGRRGRRGRRSATIPDGGSSRSNQGRGVGHIPLGHRAGDVGSKQDQQNALVDILTQAQGNAVPYREMVDVIEDVELTRDVLELADRVLNMVGVRTPITRVLAKSDDAYGEAEQRVGDLVQRRPDDARANQKFDQVSQSKALLLQQKIEGDNLSQLLNSTDPDKVAALARALNDGDQARQLGALCLADAFLGNGDRLPGNTGNVVLDAFGFVAIDNDADAPSPEAYAWEKTAEGLCMVYTVCHYNPAGNFLEKAPF